MSVLRSSGSSVSCVREQGSRPAIDKQAAHGSFRNWANITTHILAGMKKLNLAHVNEDLVRWVYSKIGGM